MEWVERLVTREDPTRGFGYLEEAGRLDLTAEALVVDSSKPYHGLFSQEAIDASAARLAAAQAARLAAPAAVASQGGGMRFSSKARAVLDALYPAIGGTTELPSEAERVARFEHDSMVRSPHVLRAAEAYMRRNRASHDSV